jgi:hypothetical protein
MTVGVVGFVNLGKSRQKFLANPGEMGAVKKVGNF